MKLRTVRSPWAAPVVAALASAMTLVLPSCATLEPIAENTCGNGVVDPGEESR